MNCGWNILNLPFISLFNKEPSWFTFRIKVKPRSFFFQLGELNVPFLLFFLNKKYFELNMMKNSGFHEE
jgi:hypothetical protein